MRIIDGLWEEPGGHEQFIFANLVEQAPCLVISKGSFAVENMKYFSDVGSLIERYFA